METIEILMKTPLMVLLEDSDFITIKNTNRTYTVIKCRKKIDKMNLTQEEYNEIILQVKNPIIILQETMQKYDMKILMK